MTTDIELFAITEPLQRELEKARDRETELRQREARGAELAVDWAVQDFVRALNHLGRLGVAVEPDGLGLFELAWSHGRHVRRADVVLDDGNDATSWTAGTFR